MHVDLRATTVAGLGLVFVPSAFAQQAAPSGPGSATTATPPGGADAAATTGTEGDASASWLWIAILAVVVLVVLGVVKFMVSGRRPPPAV